MNKGKSTRTPKPFTRRSLKSCSTILLSCFLFMSTFVGTVSAFENRLDGVDIIPKDLFQQLFHGVSFMTIVEKFWGIALGIAIGVMFVSTFASIFIIVNASLSGDSDSLAEGRVGLMTAMVSIGFLGLMPSIIGILYKLAGIKLIIS